VRVIKWRGVRWAGHVARMGEERGVFRVLVERTEGKRPLGDLGVDGWIILGLNCRSWDVGIWTRLGWPRIGTGGGLCECGNEHSCSVKCGEFLD
jgi:hypothetical protein